MKEAILKIAYGGTATRNVSMKEKMCFTGWEAVRSGRTGDKFASSLLSCVHGPCLLLERTALESVE